MSYDRTRSIFGLDSDQTNNQIDQARLNGIGESGSSAATGGSTFINAPHASYDGHVAHVSAEIKRAGLHNAYRYIRRAKRFIICIAAGAKVHQ